jgi:hypothetical protein
MSSLKGAVTDRTKWATSTEEVCDEAKDLLTRFTKQMSKTSIESLKVVRKWSSGKGEKLAK